MRLRKERVERRIDGGTVMRDPITDVGATAFASWRVSPRAALTKLAVDIRAKLGSVIVEPELPERLAQHFARKYSPQNLPSVQVNVRRWRGIPGDLLRVVEVIVVVASPTADGERER
jgi:hypothetical protein